MREQRRQSKGGTASTIGALAAPALALLAGAAVLALVLLVEAADSAVTSRKSYRAGSLEEDVMEEQATTVVEKTLDRRRFTLATAMAMLAGVAITITEACGSSSSSPTSSSGGSGGAGATGSSGSGDKVGAISSNHGHSAVITAAQLSAGGDLTLNIQGTATHNHTVALTQAQLVSIAGGTRVAQDSSTDSGHAHTVTFNA